jgi:hypothetical protein
MHQAATAANTMVIIKHYMPPDEEHAITSKKSYQQLAL